MLRQESFENQPPATLVLQLLGPGNSFRPRLFSL